MSATGREPRTVYLETFGCQMNHADSDAVLGRLRLAGWTPVESIEDAGFVLYNTCSVRDHAEARVRGRLGRLKAVKAARPGLRIGIMGCQAQREKSKLLDRHPHVDLVMGTDQFRHVADLLDRIEAGERIAATAFEDWDEGHGADRTPAPGAVNAMVPIMRGCNYSCTYCVVPGTRGREKSRPMPEVIEEVRRLAAAGVPQVTLLGQTVDAYGKTLGDGTTLARLLRELDRIDGLHRIRFVTSHPKDITDDLLHAMADCAKVAKHLHVPAQHGSDRILRLMGRRYTRADYLSVIERARRIIPGVEILTDLITGFPSETDEDFQAIASLMDEVRFDAAYVYAYSLRPGTPAVGLPDDVPLAVKKQRRNDLLALQLVHQDAANRGRVGRCFAVLVEGVSDGNPDRLHGRSEGNLNIVFPRRDPSGASRDHLIGRIATVRVVESTALTLIGELDAAVTAATLIDGPRGVGV